MKKKELKTLREKSLETLVSDADKMQLELTAHLAKLSGSEKNLKVKKLLKKKIAQTLTVISEMKAKENK